MQIDFENYSIAPVHIKDAWRICDFVVSNSERLKPFFPQTLKANLTPTLAEIFVKTKVKQFGNREEYLFTIKENTNRTIIGLLYVKELFKAPNQAELAYCISYQYEGRGITSKLVSEIVDWSFNHLGLQTLQIIAHKTNLGSLRVAEKNGFTFQKTLSKSHQKFDGESVDMELYELYNKVP